MADQKITALTELAATPDGADLLAIVDDPSGTPATKKITVTNLLAAGGGEASAYALPGMGFTSGLIEQAGGTNDRGFAAVTTFEDGATDNWNVTVPVPDGADGLSLSAIKILFINENGDPDDVVLAAGTSHYDFASDSAPVNDGTDTVRAYTIADVGSTNDLDIITLNADVFNAIAGITLAKGDYIGMRLQRRGAEAADTLSAKFRVVGIRFEFA